MMHAAALKMLPGLRLRSFRQQDAELVALLLLNTNGAHAHAHAVGFSTRLTLAALQTRSLRVAWLDRRIEVAHPAGPGGLSFLQGVSLAVSVLVAGTPSPMAVAPGAHHHCQCATLPHCQLRGHRAPLATCKLKLHSGRAQPGTAAECQ